MNKNQNQKISLMTNNTSTNFAIPLSLKLGGSDPTHKNRVGS